MIKLKFKSKEHEEAFYFLLKRCRIYTKDLERVALVYLLTITEDCRKHFFECYDGEHGIIKPEVLKKGWVTGSDGRAIRLAFNLYNGRIPYADIADIKMSDDCKNLFDEYGNFSSNGVNC